MIETIKEIDIVIVDIFRVMFNDYNLNWLYGYIFSSKVI